MSDAMITAALDGLLNLLDEATAKAATDDPADADESSPRNPVPSTHAAVETTTRIRDAIDAELNAAPRTTAVQSLRLAPVVQAFRQELLDGMIRVDSVNQLLRLVNQVVVRLLA